MVAPVRVAESVWPVETELWRPDLSIAVASGSNRDAALAGSTDITAISRDNLKHALAHAGKWRTIILDELSSFKNRSSQRWKFARKLTKDAPYVWGLTGTPAPNGLLDLWAQAFLIDNGDALGATLGGYRDRYFSPGHRLPSGIITGWDLRPGAAKRIHERLEHRFLSMGTEGRVQLPPLTNNVVEVPLPAKVRSLYRRLKDDLVTDLTDLGLDSPEMFSAANAAVLSNRLSQVSSGFLYSDERLDGDNTYQVVHTEKIKAVREIVEGTGSPVMVAYQFQAELDQLKREFPDAQTPDTPAVIRRWNAGHIQVLLVHPRSAGHGLNLQHGGHTMVWMSLPWSLEEYQQTYKRLLRSGQKHPVVVHHLVAPRTVDKAVLQALTAKRSVQDALLDHLELNVRSTTA